MVELSLKKVSSKHETQLSVILVAGVLVLFVFSPWQLIRWFAIAPICVLVLSVFVLCVSEKKRPFEVLWERWAIYRVERALLLADIVWSQVSAQSKGRVLCKLPDVELDRVDDFVLRVKIRNSLKYQDRLLETDLSPALDGWVTDKIRMNNDRSWVVFTMVREGADVGYRFNSMDSLGAFIVSNKESGLIPLDRLRSFKADAHSLVAGVTGSGKSIALLYLVLFYVRIGWRVGICDPKQSDLFALGKAFNARVCSDKGALELIDEFLELLQKRKDQMASANAFMSTALEYGLPGVVLVIDEYASLMAKLDKNDRAEFESKMTTLVLEGRQLGVFVVLAMQQAHSSNVKTQIRENLANVLVLGNSGEQTYRTAFGDLAGSVLRGVSVEPGTGFALVEGEASPVFVRVPWFTRELIDEVRKFVRGTHYRRALKAPYLMDSTGAGG